MSKQNPKINPKFSDTKEKEDKNNEHKIDMQVSTDGEHPLELTRDSKDVLPEYKFLGYELRNRVRVEIYRDCNGNTGTKDELNSIKYASMIK